MHPYPHNALGSGFIDPDNPNPDYNFEKFIDDQIQLLHRENVDARERRSSR
jgi:hypothetical protein